MQYTYYIYIDVKLSNNIHIMLSRWVSVYWKRLQDKRKTACRIALTWHYLEWQRLEYSRLKQLRVHRLDVFVKYILNPSVQSADT